MANTARGYPYPLSTDPVAQGATAIQNLAQAVNDKAGVAAAGTVNVNVNNANSGSVTVVFPAGRFTSAPAVFLGQTQGAPSQWLVSNGSGMSASSVTLWVRHVDATVSTATVIVRWLALDI